MAWDNSLFIFISGLFQVLAFLSFALLKPVDYLANVLKRNLNILSLIKSAEFSFFAQLFMAINSVGFSQSLSCISQLRAAHKLGRFVVPVSLNSFESRYWEDGHLMSTLHRTRSSSSFQQSFVWNFFKSVPATLQYVKTN
jgi:hypothetical protein